mmetsp:Transcript_22443/g.23376  ORF Transcript_22443/g.23376 Transcript_22443/m.23376 type:complete len:235 (+) Transcript_22443:22-726(+)
MNLEYFPAPMHYIDGVPAYKTGEWTGHKSCKFGPTRRIVQQVSNQKFSLSEMEGQVNLMARKKKFLPYIHKEYEFKPSLKQVPDPIKTKERIESIKYIKQDITQRKERYEKKHKFGYIVERDLIAKEVLESKGREDFVTEEMKNIGKVGFAKGKDYGKLPTKSKYKLDNLTSDDSYIPKENPANHYKWNVKDDIKYVKALSNFEARFLPDLNVLSAPKEEVNKEKEQLQNSKDN